jgi:hypothetical protein
LSALVLTWFPLRTLLRRGIGYLPVQAKQVLTQPPPRSPFGGAAADRPAGRRQRQRTQCDQTDGK